MRWSAAVIELAVISVLAGIALGLRYKVVILVPAVILAVIFAVMVGIARGDDFWSITLAMLTAGTLVQTRLPGWNYDTRRGRMNHPAPPYPGNPTARPGF